MSNYSELTNLLKEIKSNILRKEGEIYRKQGDVQRSTFNGPNVDMKCIMLKVLCVKIC